MCDVIQLKSIEKHYERERKTLEYSAIRAALTVVEIKQLMCTIF